MGLDRLARTQCVTAFCLLTALGCGGSNEPSVASGNTAAGSGAATAATNSGTGAAAGSTPATPASGSSGAGSPASGAAGKTSTGSGGTGGSMMTPASGGSTAGAGMSASAGTGNASAGTGGETSAGTGGSTGTMSGMFSPSCSEVPPTAAGEAPTKGGACTASDPQLCYKTCGPQSIGFKSETCMNGAYVEQSGCSFPDADYACFKIPAMVDPTCPTMTPQATMPCEVAACTPCSVSGNYLDSSGASKTGYCVCPMAGASGSRKWSCASNTAWPCPTGRGC